jgi:hypothetical protein
MERQEGFTMKGAVARKMERSLGLGLVLSLWIPCACAGLPGWKGGFWEDEFEDAQRRYTQLIRWAEFGEASNYVDPARRDQFFVTVEALAEVRFTDYAVRFKEVSPARDSATVHVTYRAYRLSSMVETQFEERQEWSREWTTGHWLVRSEFVEQHARLAPPEL